ncbi:hypothetical protein [Taibaiella soli]|uniref:Uncharacterized protein n=1 Tax=Taibaiella soli TaxID=1649169 RepID=A0A2W2B8B8_9BACT|nr:hypothetical protein [Taibaiella soli]PZF72519.1 hypothetical protein DN068_11685 [Taibaiella soli]
MKKLILYSLLFVTAKAFGQNDQTLLRTRLNNLTTEQTDAFAKSMILSPSDHQLFGAYLAKTMPTGPEKDTITLGTIVNRFLAYKKDQDAKLAAGNQFGTDSFFVRTPDGERIFLGMGQLSFDKLVLQNMNDLPASYKDSLSKIGFTDMEVVANAMPALHLDPESAMIFGNVLMTLHEQRKDLKKYKIGDILVITERIKKEPAFRQFADKMK